MNAQRFEPFIEPIYVTRPLCPPLSELMKKLEEIWTSKLLTNMGPQHKLLEDELKTLLKVANLSLFNNGTIALLTACKALQLSGEVITTPFTFAATPHVLAWNNIKPVFCDIEPDTMNIDANKIEKLITPETTALMPVHVFGTPCNVGKIQEIADQYGLRVIYDAAHAFGVELDGTGIGKYGDISMVSFHSTKLFHSIEGGALLYNDNSLKRRIEMMKNFGIKNEEEVLFSGINGKMNEVQAAVGLLVLKYVELERNKRKHLIEIYKECLKNIAGISFLPQLPNVKSNYQYMVIRIDRTLFGRSRDEVYDAFKQYNVFSRKYFYPLCSEYDCYKDLPSSAASGLPVAYKVVDEVLSLPLYGELSPEEVYKIASILISFQTGA